MAHLREFRKGDRRFALELIAAEGWETNPVLWDLLVAGKGRGGYVAEESNHRVGLAFVLRFQRTGWIHDVIVAPPWRRRGLGAELMDRAINDLHAAGIETIHLDATTGGEPLYRKIGFRDDFQALRFGGIPQWSLPAADPREVGPVSRKDLVSLLELDSQFFGDDRSDLLVGLWQGYPKLSAALRGRGGKVEGFALARPFAGGHVIGPVVAGPQDIDGVRTLIRNMEEFLGGASVKLYVPGVDPLPVRFAKEAKLASLASSNRMTLGPAASQMGIWAELSGECG
jgi:GNAT superfamily N-acetyltransferase